MTPTPGTARLPGRRALVAELTEALRTVALGGGASVAEIAQRFAGHGPLAGDRTTRTRPADRELWFHSVIELKPWRVGGSLDALPPA